MAKIEAIPVKEFLKYTVDDISNDISGDIYILFEDNITVLMSATEIIVSRYFWELFIYYNTLPLTSDYIVSKYYTNNMYTGKTHTGLLSVLMKELIDKVFDKNDIQNSLTILYKKMFIILELLYSKLSYEIINNVSSLNILNLLDIQLNKELMASMNKVSTEMNIESIDKAYDVIDFIIRNNSEFSNNPVAKAYISGMVNKNQMKQVLGPRGYVTELDSSIFKYPIASSFTLGMKNMYELATDSRSGAKALYLSNKAIQSSEYFGRELHIATMPVEKLIFTDCGTTEYLDWYVKPKEESNGTVIYEGDLNNLIGKWYLNEETNKLEVITKNSTELYGKTIKLRSVLKCKLNNERHVCSKCFGELSYGVSEHFNLGHVCSTEINAKISQSILSTKHLAASAVSNNIVLGDIANKFFAIKDQNGYVLRKHMMSNKNKISIIVSQEECFGLKDIKSDKSINTLDPGRVTKIESMTVKYETKTKTDYFVIPVKAGNRYGVFELKFLSYISEHGYSTDENGNYVIDISSWTSVTPIMRLPEVEFSFLALSKDTKDMFKSMSILKGGVSKDSPESLLSKVFTLVNSKLNLNIALFEVVVYAFTVKDLANGNYDLGRNSDNPQLSNLLTIVDRRSAGGSLGYDNLSGKLLQPHMFNRKNKTSHPLDVMILPQEVLSKDIVKNITNL